jgi:hypothetical protein
MSSTPSVVAAAGLPTTPLGGRHQHLLQLQWWLLPKYRQHPSGASHRRLAKVGTCRQYFSGDTYQGATTVNTTTTSKTSFEKKYFWVLAVLRTWE